MLSYDSVHLDTSIDLQAHLFDYAQFRQVSRFTEMDQVISVSF